MIFREFIKKALIKKNDKELLLIQCLKKDPLIRTKDENNTIKNFLLHSKLINALLEIPFFEPKNCDNIISAISNEIKIKNLKEEEILFRIGTNIDNLYIIYNGAILIENLDSYAVPLTCRQYIKSIIDRYKKIYHYKDKYSINEKNKLLNYKKIPLNDDNYLIFIFDKIIKSNKDIINIENDEIPLLNLILLIVDIKNLFKDIRANYDILLLLIQDYQYDHKRILNGMEYLQNNFFVHNIEFNMKLIYKNIPEINPKLIEKYESIIETKTIFNFNYFRKGKIIHMQNMGECFGDIYPELKFNNNYNDLKRNYTVSSIEKSILAYISFERFNEFLKLEKEEIKNAESKFLKTSFFFKDINQFLFSKKYLKYFIYEELPYNNFLFTQGKKDDYVYFTKFGQYEIYCMKNIKTICKIINEISNNYLDDSKNKFIQKAKDLYKKIQWCGIIKKDFLIEIPIKLFILTKHFALGLESLFNDLPYLYNVKILSEKCGFYKIENKYLLQLMNEIKHGKDILNYEKNKYLAFILERLVNICHKKVKYINNERKSYLLNYNEISNKLNKGKLKKKVLNNKLKEYLKDYNKKLYFDKNYKTNDINDEDDDNFLIKSINKKKLYFLTEINSKSNEKKNNTDIIDQKPLGKSYRKFNSILKDDNNKHNKYNISFKKKYNLKDFFL